MPISSCSQKSPSGVPVRMAHHVQGQDVAQRPFFSMRCTESRPAKSLVSGKFIVRSACKFQGILLALTLNSLAIERYSRSNLPSSTHPSSINHHLSRIRPPINLSTPFFPYSFPSIQHRFATLLLLATRFCSVGIALPNSPMST